MVDHEGGREAVQALQVDRGAGHAAPPISAARWLALAGDGIAGPIGQRLAAPGGRAAPRRGRLVIDGRFVLLVGSGGGTEPPKARTSLALPLASPLEEKLLCFEVVIGVVKNSPSAPFRRRAAPANHPFES